MKKCRKLLAMACACACLLALVSGCSNSSSSSSSSASSAGSNSGSSASSGGSTATTTDFPKDTVNIICHAAAGGGTDAMLRQVASVIQDQLGWTMTVENMSGGSGSVAIQYVMSSEPDGYTIGSAPVELSMIEALGYTDVGPDDVQLLGMAMSQPAALYVSASAEYTTLEEFIAYCQANPGKVRIANSGIGSIWHIAACVLADQTGIEIQHIPYDGASGAMTALLGNEIEACVVGAGEGYAYVESGDMICLAVFGPERSSLMPDAPTAIECGYEDLTVLSWAGILGPKGMDEGVLNTLVDALKTAFESEEYIAFCEGRGMDPTYYSPDEFLTLAQGDYEYYSELITRLGIAS